MNKKNLPFELPCYLFSILLFGFAIYEIYEAFIVSGIVFCFFSVMVLRRNYWAMIFLKYFLYIAAIVTAGGILNPYSVAEIQSELKMDPVNVVLMLLIAVIALEAIYFSIIKFISAFSARFARRLF